VRGSLGTGPTETVLELPNGVAIYRQQSRAGGYLYYTDEIDGGVLVWDTSLVSECALVTVLHLEAVRRMEERVEQQAGTATKA